MQNVIDSLREALSKLSIAITAVNEAEEFISEAWLNSEAGSDLEDNIHDLTYESQDLEQPINEVYNKISDIIRELGEKEND